MEMCARVCFGAAVCIQPPSSPDLRNIGIQDETDYRGLILAVPHCQSLITVLDCETSVVQRYIVAKVAKCDLLSVFIMD